MLQLKSMENRLRELTEANRKYRELEKELRSRDAILEAVSFAVKKFLKGDEWDKCINDVLNRLGRATGVSRVYILKIENGNNKDISYIYRFEWVAEGIDSLRTNPSLKNINFETNRIRRWEEILSKGLVIQGHVRDFPKPEQKLLTQQGIKSVVAVPIFVNSHWWGFIGFDECIREREWSDAEIEALKIAADIIGAAIQRREAEKKLQENKERYKSLCENSPDIIFTLGYNGIFTYVNPSFEKILGYKREEVIGKRFISFIKDNPKKYLSWYKRMWEGKETLRDVDITLAHKDGSYRLFNASGVPEINSEGEVEAIVGFLKDITEHRILEAQLRHSQKMEAVGNLAGGIAHDFNNILQAILGYVQILLMKKDSSDPDYNFLREIQTMAEKGADLTKRLLLFGKRVESELRPVSLNQLVEQVTKILKETIPRMIHIETDFSKDPGIINADPVQLEQVLMNLGINARDAMPDGGRLLFKTEKIHLDWEQCKAYPPLKPGDYVLLTVSDTGLGMTREIMDHIFEPFFTTKESGKGTGLGLSIVYRIVKNHGGYITCDSIPGQGTTFKVFFPAIKQQADKEKRPETIESPVVGGDETILLVDDEEPILNMGRNILRRFGYNVFVAKNGEEAVEIYKNKKDNIDLIILDISMPGMGGHKCLKELKKINKNVKVLIASGYMPEGKVEETLKAGAIGFIAKPYHLKDMLKIVRESLDKN